MSRIDALRSLLETSPDNCFLRYGLAQEHAKAGDDEAAVQEFGRILEIDPAYQAAYYHGGKALQRLGRADQARDLFQRGIEASVASGDLHARGELEAALAELGAGS